MTEQPGTSAPTPDRDGEESSNQASEDNTVLPEAPPSNVALGAADDNADNDAVEAVEAVEADAPRKPGRKKRVLRWFGWSAASLGVLALMGLSVYLVDVTRKWEDRVDELTAISTDLGQQVADAQSAQLDAEARMEAAQEELDNATSRISDLANEEAHANDRESTLIEFVDAMTSCADSRQELINVLTDSRYYYPGKTNYQVEQEISKYCKGVSSDFKDFKKEIQQ